MLVPAFDYNLDCVIPVGLAAIGQFDGKHPGMACATTGGRVLIHQPYINKAALEERATGTGPGAEAKATLLQQQNKLNAGKESDIQYLNTNKEIVALSCGKLDARKPETDLVFIGSNTNILVYDCTNNADVFDKEINDGVASLGMCDGGALPNVMEPTVVIGGNSSVSAVDINGDECFWTVSGGVVSSIAFMDFDNDGLDEMVTGSDDAAIRVLKGEDSIHEVAEKAQVSALSKIDDSSFAYALKNGAYGVYKLKKRQWRQKSKDQVTAICGCNIDMYGKGQLLVVAGFMSGAIEVREHLSGQVIQQTKIEDSGCISNIFFYDYRMTGQSQVVVVTEQGIIQGYTLTQNAQQFDLTEDGASNAASEKLLELNREKIELQNRIAELKKKKEQLANQELELQESNVNFVLGNGGVPIIDGNFATSQLPASEDVRIQNVANLENQATDMTLEITRKGWIVKGIVINSEKLFAENGGTYVQVFSQSSSKASVPIVNPKNTEELMELKIMVGQGIDSQSFHTIKMPQLKIRKFQMFVLKTEQDQIGVEEDSFVSANVETFIEAQQFAKWVQQSFPISQNINKHIAIDASDNSMTLWALDVRNGAPLKIRIENDERESSSALFVFTESMQTASDVIQDFVGQFLGVSELQSLAMFPKEMYRLNEEILEKIKQSNQLKTHFAANISESIQNLKVSVVKAEASLIIHDIENMRKNYAMVQQENGTLIGEYVKRANNHQELVATLKELNTMIRLSSSLRIGQASKRIVAQARDCIRTQSFQNIQNIFENGGRVTD